jgi:hypothetical protein
VKKISFYNGVLLYTINRGLLRFPETEDSLLSAEQQQERKKKLNKGELGKYQLSRNSTNLHLIWLQRPNYFQEKLSGGKKKK